MTVSGPVSAVEEMQLGVELSGQRVTALKVDVGQQVRRGQVLLTLDHRMLDADLAQKWFGVPSPPLVPSGGRAAWLAENGG